MLAYSYLRFSFSEQAKGDSIRRQVAARDAYLTRMGHSLDTSFMLPPDRGRSAFRGKNRTTGNLSLFLDACKQGRIKRGSLLLLENLDRLTREESEIALEVFKNILGYGVTIVTLTPEMEFKPGEMNFGKWVMALSEICRGHSESLMKSVRGKAKWEARRASAETKPMTSRCPSWLDVVDRNYKANRTQLAFKLNERKADTVRKIYKLAADGYGISAIAKKLNREGVPTISKAPHWHDSYVYKVLINRAVVGEYQPRKRDENQDLVPVGQPIKDYFPAVVTAAQWAKARTAIRSRKTSGGRVTSDVANLFTGLVRTPGGVTFAMRVRNGYPYLNQNTIAQGLAHNVNGIPYRGFEKVVLAWLREVKLDFGGEDVTSGLESQREDITATIAELEAGIRKGGKSVARLVVLLEEKESELAAVNEALELALIPKANQFGHTQTLIAILETCSPEERESIRRQIKQQIRFLVKSIEVRTEGVPRNPNKRHYLTITFSDGKQRRIWFDTGRKGVINQGLWSLDGKLSPEDRRIVEENTKTVATPIAIIGPAVTEWGEKVHVTTWVSLGANRKPEREVAIVAVPEKFRDLPT
jgi:DNA invertase Pin-like site-specific DNA recombinase